MNFISKTICVSLMKKFNLLSSFPKSNRNLKNRKISKKNINIALKYSKEYFDGKRSQGYGGYYYDGRWVDIARKLIRLFKLKSYHKFLDIGCAKGFLMHDVLTINPKIKVYGIEISKYAINNSIYTVRKKIKKYNCKILPFRKNYFNCVVAINVIHNLNINDCKKAIMEIQRISGGKAYIQVDAYRNQEELKVLKKWILTAKTYLKPHEWLKVFKECGYTGYYNFTILKIDKWLKK